MTLKPKYFTIEDAETLLPKIMEIMTAARELKKIIEEKVDAWRKIQKTITESEEAVVRGQIDFMASRLETLVGGITELGCFPKDLDQGLVDFPARVDGVEGYLCWKFGEPKIRFWHRLTDGYAGRKPLKKEA